MTEQEKASFLRNVNRAPGKRRIVPTKHFFNDLADGDSESDHDFAISDDGDSDDGSSATSSDNESAGSGDDSAHGSESIGVEDSVEDKKPNQQKQAHVCCVCLCLETPDHMISKCDRCGIVVHDSCYGSIEDDGDSVSSSAEVPWFCEPCLFGLIEPPRCELCPSRFGAFKRTDVGQNWVHVVCSHYLSRVTYADAERFIAVSYQEVDFKMFGRKPCNGCIDEINARTGIVVQCEAGMCKNHYHVTCAQRLGLLVELDVGDHNSSHEDHVGHLLCKKHTLSEDAKRRKARADQMMAYENKRMILIRRRALSAHEERYRQKQRNAYDNHIEPLINVNILTPGPANAKRIRLVQSSAEIIDGFANKAEMALGIGRDRFTKELCKIPTENLSLGLNLSFTEESVRSFEYRENVLFGEQEQYLEELKISKEEALQKEQDLKQEVADLEATQLETVNKSKTVTDLCSTFVDLLIPLGAKGVSKAFLKLPKDFPQKPVIKQRKTKADKKTSAAKAERKTQTNKPTTQKAKRMNTPAPLPRMNNTAPEVITISDDDGPPVLEAEMTTPSVPNLPSSHKGVKPAKSELQSGRACSSFTADAYNSFNGVRAISEGPNVSAASTPGGAPTKGRGRNRRVLPGDGLPKICKKCNKDNDPHLMPFCDECKSFYHIGCLDPPLTKMPRTSRFYRWFCSDCNEENEDSKEEVEEKSKNKTQTDESMNGHGADESEEENVATRKKPREQAAAFRTAKAMTNEDVDRELDSLIRREKRVSRNGDQHEPQKRSRQMI